MSELTDKLIASFQELLDSVVAAAPKVLTGLILLILAVLICKIVEKVLRAVLTRVKFDDLVKKAGVDSTLQRLGVRQDLNRFLPRLVYFLLLTVMAKTLADVLGLVAVSDALSAFFVYLPNLIAALLLFILGSAAAQFAGGAVTQAGRSAGLDFAPALGRVVSALIFFIVGMMAVAQLKIDTDIIRIVTSLFLAGVALAFGLSVGLGSRDITRNIMAGFYAKKVLQVGERLEIDGESGTLQAITATHTILDQDGRRVAIANDTLLDKVGKQ